MKWTRIKFYDVLKKSFQIEKTTMITIRNDLIVCQIIKNKKTIMIIKQKNSNNLKNKNSFVSMKKM